MSEKCGSQEIFGVLIRLEFVLIRLELRLTSLDKFDKLSYYKLKKHMKLFYKDYESEDE